MLQGGTQDTVIPIIRGAKGILAWRLIKPLMERLLSTALAIQWSSSWWNGRLANCNTCQLPCTHITRRLSNILNICVKKLLKKMITLLFVLFGLLTIRAFWMKDNFSSVSTKLEHYIYVVDVINHMYICMRRRIWSRRCHVKSDGYNSFVVELMIKIILRWMDV